jgi:hypothetical protein
LAFGIRAEDLVSAIPSYFLFYAMKRPTIGPDLAPYFFRQLAKEERRSIQAPRLGSRLAGSIPGPNDDRSVSGLWVLGQGFKVVSLRPVEPIGLFTDWSF